MERRVPKNDKYSHIRGTLDTGLTVEKVKFITAREYSKRRDEIFYRINKNQLFELLNEYEVDEYESIAETTNNSLKIVSYSETAGPVYEKPYLILDVRELDYFNEYHILQARSFPYQMLRRDQMHSEVYRFKNKPETLIIICCDDEKISHESAKVMVDRGVDNVYLLTGGIHEFAYEYPQFIEGRPPAPPKAATRGPRSSASTLSRIHEDDRSTQQGNSPSKYGSTNSASVRAGTSSSTLTSNQLQRHNRTFAPAASSSGAARHGYTGGIAERDRDPAVSSTRGSPGADRKGPSAGGRGFASGRSDAGYSTNSTKSVAESVISQAANRKGRF
eukprot:CAMPEP_0184969446 /NCGR_PEP_ID=MMETSP1098-20130426/2191_1 /TAXON_ID=89044 /ORGANISM="Spumella elongata, Strain CCAP 955/1" /LENGTH=331 /DNA_ID=CAMNT_0027491207 /DNA_START=130 /DNA_END=1125 /DNA_ORIENTATION=+